MPVKFVLRVDDVGQALDQKEPDRGLAYFRRWWNLGGWDGLPVYLGVVPAVCGEWERDHLSDLSSPTGPAVALHGWDHSMRVLTESDVVKAAGAFPDSRVVVPPYNLYDGGTVEAVARYLGPGAAVLGGFDRDSHKYGPSPVRVGGVLHLSADHRLYARCYQLVPVVAELVEKHESEETVTVLQIVLHHRWDAITLEGVRQLRDAIGPHLIRIEDVKV